MFKMSPTNESLHSRLDINSIVLISINPPREPNIAKWKSNSIVNMRPPIVIKWCMTMVVGDATDLGTTNIHKVSRTTYVRKTDIYKNKLSGLKFVNRCILETNMNGMEIKLK